MRCIISPNHTLRACIFRASRNYFILYFPKKHTILVASRAVPLGYKNPTASLYSNYSISPVRCHCRAMGVPSEPGQKGVNWSNIAVGEHVMSRLYPPCADANPQRWYYEHGKFNL